MGENIFATTMAVCQSAIVNESQSEQEDENMSERMNAVASLTVKCSYGCVHNQVRNSN